ncbi:MAG: NAD(P)H-hydrate dehydratase [Georgfuchsia sp.]
MTTQTLLQSATLREIEKTHANARPPLMERAGKAAAELALELQTGLAGPPLILAGPGNNGGDALVVARILKECGLDPAVVFLGHADKLPTDARKALERWSAIGCCQSDIPAKKYGLVVDGLFGIGLTRPLEEPWLSLILRINAYCGPILAIDCPSGLNADTGTLNPIAVRATHTITFIANKPGLLTLNGPDHCGEITVADISLANSVNSQRSAGRVNDVGLFADFLLPRQRNSHKGSFGSTAIIGGAPTMAGAALLAGSAALKLGAGRVFVGMLERIAVDYGQPELMLKSPGEALKLATAIAIGPGLAQSDEAVNLLRSSIEAALPLVIDADALNLLAAHPIVARKVARRSVSTLLSPHPAEAARLLGCGIEAIQSDRVAYAVELAQRFHAYVVLKGCGSIIATPEGNWFINTTGNAGLATAGSGDVLTGFCVALLAQGWTAEAATLGATWLHGAAADSLVADGQGPIGITAGELIAPARQIFNRLCSTSS